MPKTNSTDNVKTNETLKYCRNPERTDKFVMVTFDLLERGKYLTVPAKWLYVVLRSFRNEKTGQTFPSYKKIMQRGGLTRNAVAKGLNELEQFGWIKRVKTKGGKSSIYKFSYPVRLNENGEEVGNQTYPTKEIASELAKNNRKKTKNKF